MRGRVRCWSRAGWKKQQAKWARLTPELGRLDDWRGYTTGRPRLEINLPPNVCGELSTLQNDGSPVWKNAWPDALAYSLGMLGHEARHFSGAFDEWTAECYGMQSIRALAVELGRTPKEGQYLASLYRKHTYSRGSPAYRTPQCRNGGEFDLRPRSNVWP